MVAERGDACIVDRTLCLGPGISSGRGGRWYSLCGCELRGECVSPYIYLSCCCFVIVDCVAH